MALLFKGASKLDPNANPEVWGCVGAPTRTCLTGAQARAQDAVHQNKEEEKRKQFNKVNHHHNKKHKGRAPSTSCSSSGCGCRLSPPYSGPRVPGSLAWSGLQFVLLLKCGRSEDVSGMSSSRGLLLE